MKREREIKVLGEKKGMPQNLLQIESASYNLLNWGFGFIVYIVGVYLVSVFQAPKMSLFAAFSICKVAKEAAGVAGALMIAKFKAYQFFVVDCHISLY